METVTRRARQSARQGIEGTMNGVINKRFRALNPPLTVIEVASGICFEFSMACWRIGSTSRFLNDEV